MNEKFPNYKKRIYCPRNFGQFLFEIFEKNFFTRKLFNFVSKTNKIQN